MNRFERTRNTLYELMNILTRIEEKEKERETAVEYNKTNHIKELEINVQEIIDERKNLEYEFKDLTLKLRL